MKHFSRGLVLKLGLVGGLAGLTACGPTQKPDTYAGYVEADAVAISAPQSGWLKAVAVDRGAQISDGEMLFSLDDAQARTGLAGAEGRAGAAQATAQDLTKGARDADIAPLDAQRAQAQSALDLARANQARYEALFAKAYVSEAQMDALRQATRSAEAALANIDKTIADKKLAARQDQIAAARSQAAAASADLSNAQWVVDDRSIHARLSGRVDERLREPGEFVAAGQPVLTVLPRGREFVRFYVPQSVLSRLKIGQDVRLNCDGCRTQTAHIRFVAHEAEFTPPVIYSVKERQKLIFLIEATPADPEALHAGQPVDVSL